MSESYVKIILTVSITTDTNPGVIDNNQFNSDLYIWLGHMLDNILTCIQNTYDMSILLSI